MVSEAAEGSVCGKPSVVRAKLSARVTLWYAKTIRFSIAEKFIPYWVMFNNLNFNSLEHKNDYSRAQPCTS